jgi:hypothetical protein
MTRRECSVCGARFESPYWQAKTCSAECARAYKINYMRSYNAALWRDPDRSERARTAQRAKYKKVARAKTRCAVCNGLIPCEADPRATICGSDCRRALNRSNHRRWKQENPEKMRAARKRYATKNADKLREKRRRYEKLNRDKRLKSHRAWCARNAEHLREYQKKRRREDPEKFRQYARKNYAKHRERIKEQERIRRANNLDHERAMARKRYAKARAAIEFLKEEFPEMASVLDTIGKQENQHEA